MIVTVVRTGDCYEGRVDGVRVTSDISTSEPEETARASFEQAGRLLAERRDAVLAETTRALRALYNEAWREDGDPELDEAGFRASLDVTSLDVTALENPEGLVTIYLSCGDLFAGHSIEVDLERDGRFLDAPHLVG